MLYTGLWGLANVSQVEGRCSAQGLSPHAGREQRGLGPPQGPIPAALPLVLRAMGKDQLMLDSQNASCAHSARARAGRAQTLHLRDGALGWGHAGNPRGAWVQLTLRGAAEPRASPSFQRPRRGSRTSRRESLPPPPTCERGRGRPPGGLGHTHHRVRSLRGQALRSRARWHPAPGNGRVKASLGASPQGWLVRGGVPLGANKANTAPTPRPREVSPRAGRAPLPHGSWCCC